MSGADSCVFCRIVAGEIPASVVAETERALAFRDLAPVAPVHVLVVSKEHLPDASVLGEQHGALLGEIAALAAVVAGQEGVSQSGYRLVFNIGKEGGNTVAHLHLHLIGGRQLEWPPG